MATGKELRKIARSRIKSSNILFNNRQYDAAAYLSGYALECALKAAICKKLSLNKYPEKGYEDKLINLFHSHDLEILLTLSDLRKSIFNMNLPPSQLSRNWSTMVRLWKVNMRYDPIGKITNSDASEMYNALMDGQEGIINWISRKRKW